MRVPSERKVRWMNLPKRDELSLRMVWGEGWCGCGVVVGVVRAEKEKPGEGKQTERKQKANRKQTERKQKENRKQTESKQKANRNRKQTES
jgi:hypothetical protein